MSLLGDAITGVALAFAALDLTGSATDLGYVFAAKTIPLVGFLLVGGVFADRLPRRAVMLTADVARFGTQGGVALLILTHNAHIWEIVVLQAISGTASAFFNPASTGLTPMTVSPERLQQANALRGLSIASTGIIGSVISDALVAGVGAGWALALDAASFAVSAFFLAQLRLPAPVTVRRPRRPRRKAIARRCRRVGGILASLGIGSLIGGFVALRIHVRRPRNTSRPRRCRA